MFIKNINKSKIIRFVFSIICVSGCLHQIKQIGENYFSHETTTYARYEDEVMLSLPAITICIRKNFLVKNLSEISSEDTKTIIFNDSRINEFLNKLSVKRQFSLIYSAKEIFNNSCQVLKPIFSIDTNSYVKCESISPVRQSIDYFQSCFTFFSQLNEENNDRYVIEYDVRIKNYWSEMVRIKIPTTIPSIRLHLHSRNEMITDSYNDNMAKITFSFNRISYTNYHMTSVQLMPKPYKTSCVNYKEFGYNSRADCVAKCKIKYFRNEYKGWPGIYLTEEFSEELMLDIDSLLEKNESLDLILQKKCIKFCGLNDDCFKQFFGFYSEKEVYDLGDVFMVTVSPPDLPTLIFTHLPKIQVEEFICFIASIVSLWFGFSVMMLSDVCLVVFTNLNKIVYKYKTRIKIFVTIINRSREISQSGPQIRFHLK